MSQNYYNQIKTELINNEAYKRVKDYSKNRSDLATYYNVGKILITAQGGEKRNEYGNQIIKEYSRRLTKELGIGYSSRNLYNMRLFYLQVQKSQILQTVSAKLSWSHCVELINLRDINEINYYTSLCESQALSVRELRQHIKSRDYERLSLTARKKLATGTQPSLPDIVKNPIIIKNTRSDEIFSEKVLQQLILEDLPHFLKELGEGFTFIDNEYKIRTDNNYNYIDLLLFNYKYNCFVVIELKITELKAEHIGQIKKYMNYVDANLKTITQDRTIGIIITKKDNKFVIEYCSDARIKMVEWKLG